MPTRHDIELAARKLRERLNGRAFQTLPRMDITQLVREVSGEDSTRIKKDLAGQLEAALLKQGVRCYPSLAETTTGDTVRIFHTPSLLGNLVDLLMYPASEDDKDLGDMLTKVKGKWKWAMPAGPPPPAASNGGV